MVNRNKDKNLGDLFINSQRVFTDLPRQLFENFNCCTDVLIFLHTSFALITDDGFQQFNKILSDEEEAICFNLSDQPCIKGDSIAFGRSAQLAHSDSTKRFDETMSNLNLNIEQAPKLTSNAVIVQYSLAGIMSTFETKLNDQNENDGFAIPAQYYNEGPNTWSVDLILTPRKDQKYFYPV